MKNGKIDASLTLEVEVEERFHFVTDDGYPGASSLSHQIQNSN